RWDDRRYCFEQVVDTAFRVKARADGADQIRRADLDDHFLGDQIAELAAAKAFGEVPAVRSWALLVTGHRTGVRKELVGEFDGLVAVQVHIDQPARRGTGEDPDVALAPEVLCE